MMKKIIIGLVIIFFVWLLFLGESSSSNSTKTTNTSVLIPSPISKPVNLQYSSPPSNSGGSYFNGYPCTEDCSGHEAGYEWADENGIDDMDDCGGSSNSFIEGCESYVEENYSDEGYNDYDY